MRGRATPAAIGLTIGLAWGSTVAAQQTPTDYTQWRGGTRDGSASAFTAPNTWPEQLTRRWKVEVGEGYATPLLVGNRLYTLTRRDGNEVMAALDAETGKSIWETRYPAPHKIAGGAQGHGQGPKSTPLFNDGKLYTLGITGIVSCFNAADGRLLWQKPAPSVETLYNNSAMSPIADRGAVIYHVGGHNEGALTAFDATTGNIRWAWRGDGPGYASPMIATIGGMRQVVAITQKAVVGVSADSGELLWERPWLTQFSNNAITPIVLDDVVVVSGFEKGVTAFRPVVRNGKWETETRWENAEVSMFMSNPVLVGDTLYGLSQRASGQLFALSARTGKVLWLGPPREATNSAVVKAGNVLFFLNDDGELIVARSNPEKLDVIRRYMVAESATWAQPTISGRRLFVKELSALTMWTVD
jgi:hypothetical protein